MSPDRAAYTIPEVAKMLGIGRTLAYEMVQKGEIPSAPVRPGGRRRVVTRQLLDEYLAQLNAKARRA